MHLHVQQSTSNDAVGGAENATADQQLVRVVDITVPQHQ